MIFLVRHPRRVLYDQYTQCKIVKIIQPYKTLSLLEVLGVFLVTFFGSYTESSLDQPEDVSVYVPKHVARNATNTSNKLRVVYDYIIL